MKQQQAGAGAIELARILAGESHSPVVYFARMGDNVKIGTSTNLRARMQSFYLALEDVLAVFPGGEDVEDAFHEQFAASRIDGDGRRELFRIDGQLRRFLGLHRRGTGRVKPAKLPPSLLPPRELGNILDLDEELRDLEDDGIGPWDAEKAADLVDRMAYLEAHGYDPVTGPGYAGKCAYFWNATREECLTILAGRRERILRSKPRWWTRSRRSREAWQYERDRLDEIQAHADRSGIISGLFVDAMREYGLLADSTAKTTA
jgi:hypothetical protein